jgi:hypothetical protein
MPRVEIEPTTPVFEREKMIHALDRAATVIDQVLSILLKLLHCLSKLRIARESHRQHLMMAVCSRNM